MPKKVTITYPSGDSRIIDNLSDQDSIVLSGGILRDTIGKDDSREAQQARWDIGAKRDATYQGKRVRIEEDQE